MKNHLKAFHTKIWLLLNLCILIKFNKIDEFVRVYERTRYLVLFGSEKFDSIYWGLTIL